MTASSARPRQCAIVILIGSAGGRLDPSRPRVGRAVLLFHCVLCDRGGYLQHGCEIVRIRDWSTCTVRLAAVNLWVAWA